MNRNLNNNNINNNNNKSVTFGGVVHYPTLPKSQNEIKKEAESKAVSVKNRFNCGSLRNSLKLVGSNGSTLISIRLVRSKLRKREENLPTTTATPTNNTAASNNHQNNNNNNNNVIQQTINQLNANNQAAPQPTTEVANVNQTSETLPPPFLWVYHTSNGNSTTASSQYTLYNNDEDNLVHNLQCEEPGECKGFRKNLRGKWRRLVKKKPQQEVYTIPAELRDQLKQIYVY